MRYLFAVFVLFFALFAQQKTAFAEEVNIPPDIQKIKKRGTLIVAILNKDVPPFFMTNAAGKLTGYDINLAENLAHALGVEVEFDRHPQTFNDVVNEVAKGNADIGISLLSITLPRALKVNFTTPYTNLPITLLYNRLSAAQKKYSDVATDIGNATNIKLGTLAESSYVEYLNKNYPKATIVLYDNIDQGMQDVRNNKIFGFYLYEIEVKNWLRKNPEANLYVNYQVIEKTKDPISIAVSWQEGHLLNWINWFLYVNRENGELHKLEEQYFRES